jgi:hypothetical protein
MGTTNYVDTEHNIPSQYTELGTTNYVDTEHNIPSLHRELDTTNYVDTVCFPSVLLIHHSIHNVFKDFKNKKK